MNNSINDRNRKILNKFFVDMAFWIEDGCLDSQIFSTQSSLIENLLNYCNLNGFNVFWDLLEIMQNQFMEAGLNPEFPFNCGKEDVYLKELEVTGLYNNKMRVEWVFNHAGIKEDK